MQLPNIPEFVTTYLALNWIGVIPVMALRAHRHAEVRHFIRASGASAYFIADIVGGFDYRPMAAEMAAEFPSLRHVIVAGQPAPGQPALASHVAATRRDGTRCSRRPRRRRGLDDAAVRRHDLAVETDPAHPQRLCPERPFVRAGRGLRATRCSWRCCRWPTTTTWRRRACSAAFYAGGTLVSRPAPTDGYLLDIERERVTVIAAVVPLSSTGSTAMCPSASTSRR